MSRNRKTGTSMKILLHLARHGESNKWEIAQCIRKSYSNVYNSIKKLKPFLIRVSKTAPSRKNLKLDVEYYEMTFLGLLTCLRSEESWQYIDEIAKQQRDQLPLIFGKWSFFEKKEVKSRVIKRLKAKVLMIGTSQEKDILDHKDLFEKANLDMKAYAEFFREIDEALIASDSKREKHVKRDITKTVLGLKPPFLHGKELTKFISVFKEDRELREYIHNEIARIEDDYVRYLRNIKSWKSWWKQP